MFELAYFIVAWLCCNSPRTWGLTIFTMLHGIYLFISRYNCVNSNTFIMTDPEICHKRADAYAVLWIVTVIMTVRWVWYRYDIGLRHNSVTNDMVVRMYDFVIQTTTSVSVYYAINIILSGIPQIIITMVSMDSWQSQVIDAFIQTSLLVIVGIVYIYLVPNAVFAYFSDSLDEHIKGTIKLIADEKKEIEEAKFVQNFNDMFKFNEYVKQLNAETDQDRLNKLRLINQFFENRHNKLVTSQALVEHLTQHEIDALDYLKRNGLIEKLPYDSQIIKFWMCIYLNRLQELVKLEIV